MKNSRFNKIGAALVCGMANCLGCSSENYAELFEPSDDVVAPTGTEVSYNHACFQPVVQNEFKEKLSAFVPIRLINVVGEKPRPISFMRFEKSLKTSNSGFGEAGLEFFLQNVDEVVDIKLNDGTLFEGGKSEYYNYVYSVVKKYAEPNVVNVFLVDEIAQYVGGVYLGRELEQQFKGVIVLKRNDLKKTLAHELGHLFGLNHTFGLKQSFDKEKDSLNEGDRIPNTNEDCGVVNPAKNVNNGYILDRFTCKPLFIPQFTDGTTMSPPFKNIMSYSPDKCTDEFSPGQLNASKCYAAAIVPNLLRGKKEFGSSLPVLPSVGCDDSSAASLDEALELARKNREKIKTEIKVCGSIEGSLKVGMLTEGVMVLKEEVAVYGDPKQKGFATIKQEVGKPIFQLSDERGFNSFKLVDLVLEGRQSFLKPCLVGFGLNKIEIEGATILGCDQGIFVSNVGKLAVFSSTFLDNVSDSSPAISAFNTDLVFDSVNFFGNRSKLNAGDGALVTVENTMLPSSDPTAVNLMITDTNAKRFMGNVGVDGKEMGVVKILNFVDKFTTTFSGFDFENNFCRADGRCDEIIQ